MQYIVREDNLLSCREKPSTVSWKLDTQEPLGIKIALTSSEFIHSWVPKGNGLSSWSPDKREFIPWNGVPLWPELKWSKRAKWIFNT